MDKAVFLKKKFREYYKSNFIKEPPEISQREFGVGEFGKKITQRHLAFKDYREFNSFLRKETPFYVSFSGACYKFPERKPMQAKELIKADLYYEFDADDIETDCKTEHDSWQCSCGNSGQGKLANCPECGQRVSLTEWVCPRCLKAVKKQVLRLADFLENDFNLLESFSLNFSGSKGFHFHVRSAAVQALSPEARIELVDALTAHNLDLALQGFLKKEKRWLCPKPFEAVGWSKRILEALKQFFQDSSAEEVALTAGITFSQARELMEKKDLILENINKGVLLQPKKKPDEFWKNILESLIDKVKLDLDRQTSLDLHKILRVPDSIHGGTGLKAVKLGFEQLESFDALKEGVVFSSQPVNVEIKKTPKFYINGEWFGPFNQEGAELPEFAAVYLLAKNQAELKGD